MENGGHRIPRKGNLYLKHSKPDIDMDETCSG